MSANRQSKRPGPDSYDHIWSLLPVFAAFFAVILFAAAADERPMPVSYTVTFEALPEQTSEQSPPAATDVSVPAAADAMAHLPAEISEPIATF